MAVVAEIADAGRRAAVQRQAHGRGGSAGQRLTEVGTQGRELALPL